MDALIDGLGWIRDAGKWRDLDRKFSLGSLLPKNLHKFWRYTGSFTMPPCEEVVTWTVLEDTVGISERQVETYIGLFSYFCMNDKKYLSTPWKIWGLEEYIMYKLSH